MVLPFLIDPKYSRRKMVDIYQAFPMFNLVPANFKAWVSDEIKSGN